ncbi:MAG TPA: S41 family peptidase [Gemmatimonadaceae bacterium]|nr:S41 family peptidase [Gemmatimonadaceae bacterium]
MRASTVRLLLPALLAATAAPSVSLHAQAPAARSATTPSDVERLGYYRDPALHGDTLVFVAEGDLWMVSASGGTARRLTTHQGEESHPAISPDGRMLAFTASYEGPGEVYTMPIAGGVPVRRTWDGDAGAGDVVTGWTPDGKILYATSRYTTLPSRQLVELDPATGKRRLLPLAQAAQGSVDPASHTLVFTRFDAQGSHTRRYHGGTAQNLWKIGWRDDGNLPGEAVPLTADYAGTSYAPMLWQGRVYFASDRDGAMNLWSMDADGHGAEQLTHHVNFDVRAPAMDAGRIVYQLGADLRMYDVRSKQDRAIPITLASDFDQLRVRWISKPMEWLTSAHLSPDGDRVALTARGQVFVAPARQGRLVDVTRDDDVRYRNARFMPDGSHLLALSDASGEVELWRLPANGVGTSQQLTRDADVLRWDGVPSPDGRWIAHTDKNQRLWVYDVAHGTNRKVVESKYGDLGELVWSPDGRWLAFAETEPNLFTRLELYDTESQHITPITSDRYDSFAPTWSPDGHWLYFMSNRAFRSVVGSPWGSRQPEPFFDRQTEIFALALQRSARFPFAPPTELSPDSSRAMSDSAHAAPTRGARNAGAPRADSAARHAPPVVIDLDGIEQRLYQVPVPAGNYNGLDTDGKRLYWLTIANPAERKASLDAIEISNARDNKPHTVLDDVRSFELSQNGKQILVRKGSDLYVFPAGPKAPERLAESKVDLSGWTFPLDPQHELRQMYTEAWRLERDYYWDPQMRGLDWKAIRAKYQPLADRVTDREELSDVLGQMIAELETLHEFVYGGDMREGADQVLPATLGARLERDSAAGGWRVAHVYRADPDRPDRLSPLARPGVDVHEGDVILAVNGVAASSLADPGEALRDQAGKQVLLHVRSRGGERDVIVEPISPREDAELRYDEWEYTRRLAVDSLSNSTIGYVHLRAMGGANIAEWERDFYPVFNRAGLIIDVRGNRGGNIDSWVLEKLMRRAWMFWQPRVGEPYWNMQYAFRGPMIVLVDEHTASDGEAFAEGFRRLGLGKVLGTRTWGGEIWLSSSNVLVDRGIATAAEMGVYGSPGEWLIEGHGVDPDIVVDNLPASTFSGGDAQLTAAVRELQTEIREHPVTVPPAPPRPPVPSVRGARSGQ